MRAARGEQFFVEQEASLYNEKNGPVVTYVHPVLAVSPRARPAGRTVDIGWPA